jgi:hypothetical protein
MTNGLGASGRFVSVVLRFSMVINEVPARGAFAGLIFGTTPEARLTTAPK